MLEPGVQEVVGLVGGVIFVLLLWASWISLKEGEPAAARRLGFLAVLTVVPFLGAMALPGEVGGPLAWVLLAFVGFPLLVALFPFPGRNLLELGQPLPGQDERDIMFSRATLMPGTDRFEEYYRSRPEKRDLDDKFRREPGFLGSGTAHYHREGYAAADAAFWTIEMLRPYVEKEASGETDRIGSSDSAPVFKMGGKRGEDESEENPPPQPEAMSRFLEAWALKMGAHSLGVTELRDYHLYSHVGRGP